MPTTALPNQEGMTGHLPTLMHAIRPSVKDSKDPVCDNVRAQVEIGRRGMPDFALPRRNFIPLFYGVSEVFLRLP
jgi:hypothetical protein